jgi:hypothetical protein
MAFQDYYSEYLRWRELGIVASPRVDAYSPIGPQLSLWEAHETWPAGPMEISRLTGWTNLATPIKGPSSILRLGDIRQCSS